MLIFLHFLQRISSAILSFSFLRRNKIIPNIKIKMEKTMNGNNEGFASRQCGIFGDIEFSALDYFYRVTI
jgi:hypothetical protein